MELKRVVVTGLGALTPIGNNLAEFWDGLISGTSGAAPITYFNTDNFKTKFACELKNFDVLNYIDAKDAQKMDPCAHYAMVAAQEAIFDAGINSDNINPERVGVILGSGIGGYTSSVASVFAYIEMNKVPRFSPFFLPKVLGNLISGWISIKYGFKGPNYITTAACASSGAAIADAFHLIQLGKADIIVSGGAEASIVDPAVGGFNAMRALSTRNDEYQTASRPFDVTRDGFVMGEGAGILILEELEHALARGAKIYAEVGGIGLSADAYHMAAPDPSGSACYQSMKLAIEDAGLQITDIDHINTHSTSTQLGDIAECKAIEMLFGDTARQLLISATKSMTGHLLGAAAAVESIATIMAIQNSIAPPTMHLNEPDPAINPDWNLVDNHAIHHDIRAAISNSFGFGGHNISLLYKKYTK